MKEVRVAIVGAGWMGRAHATAFRSVPMVFGPDPAVPVLEVAVDINPESARTLAEAFGFKRWSSDWREVLNDPAIDVVDITTPNDMHPTIAIAAAKAGKHIYCEKPLANSYAEAKEMAEAADAAGVLTLVGFNYLKNPAQGYARQVIESGEIGDIIQFRGTFDQDFMTDPKVPFSWRQNRAMAGSGSLGDMASHTLSLSKYLVGDIAEVCGMTATYIKQRSDASSGSGMGAKADPNAKMRTVENDDVCQFLIRFESGAMGYIEASRLGTGRKLLLGYEIQLYRHTDPPAERGYKTIYIGPAHPNYAAFFPLPGIGLGYNDQKIVEAHDLMVAVATGKPAFPDFRFGLEINRVVDSVLLSDRERRWVRPAEMDEKRN